MNPTSRPPSLVSAVLAVVATILVGMFAFAPSAHAALGDDATAVVADQARLRASLRSFRGDAYTVHELGTPSGLTIRQFVADAGKVFAVSWSGAWRPNLRDIMGSHYDRYIAASRGRRVARGVARIELPGMIVVMGGPQRGSFGHVILTDLAPAGFAEKLQVQP